MTAIQRQHSCTIPAPTAARARPAHRPMRRWLVALMLVLAMSLATAIALAQPMQIEITHFAGDTILATRTDAMGEAHAVRLHPRDLVGFTWTVNACAGEHCETVTHRITAVARDTSTNTMPQYSDNSDVWLYRVESALASAPDQWLVACDEGNPDTAMGIFVNGQWSEDGTWHPDGWTFSCPSGVISKCIRSWGYKPWKKLRSPVHGEVDLQPLHQACTRAARADYCGDGISHTRNGTPVDMFDVYGFNVPEGGPGFAAESSFGEHGALSVSFPRWPTGTPTESGWRFESCERPRQAPHRSAPPLIQVWSDPNKGRSAPAK
jgi:hypothetical protein